MFDDLFDAESGEAVPSEEADSESKHFDLLEPEDLITPVVSSDPVSSEPISDPTDSADEIQILDTLDLIHDDADSNQVTQPTIQSTNADEGVETDEANETDKANNEVEPNDEFQLAPIDDSIFDNVDEAIEEHRTSGKPAETINKNDSDDSDALKVVDPVVDENEIAIQTVPTKTTRVEANEPPAPPAKKLETQDEFSLEDHLHIPDLEISEGNQDPFAVDDSKPLHIDGISPNVKSSEIYGVKCKICETRLHVTIDQAGETVECPECFSPVEVTPPGQNALALMEKHEEDEYRLAEPEEVEAPIPPIPAGHGLGTETRDLLAPAYEVPADEVASGSVDLLGSSDAEASAPARSTQAQERKREVDPEYGSKTYWEAKVKEVEDVGEPVPEILTKEKITPADYVIWIAKTFASPEVILRTLITIGMLGVMYWMASIFHATTTNEEATNVQKITGIVIPIAIGGITSVLGIIGLFTTCSMVFQNSANGLSSRDDWPGFSFSDWLGPIAFFMFSFWLGMMPGGLFGLLMSIVFEMRLLILIGATFSGFLLAPVFLMSACYNGSAFQIFSKDVFETFGTESVQWLMYVPYVFAAWVCFVIGTLILLLPTIIFATMGAGIQVFAMICFAAFTGLFVARHVMQLQAANQRRR